MVMSDGGGGGAGEGGGGALWIIILTDNAIFMSISPGQLETAP